MTKDSKQKNAKSSEVERKFQLLLTLITLLKSARHKHKKTELEFLMVNQTFNLVPYRNCVYWEFGKNKVTIKNSSGLVEIDPDGPYTQWLTRVIRDFVKHHKSTTSAKKEGQDDEISSENGFTTLLSITVENCNERDRDDWNKWVTGNVSILIMCDADDKVVGGLWIDREQNFLSLEKALLEDLGDGYAHAIQNFSAYKKRNLFSLGSFFNLSGMKAKLFFIALIILMLLPVRMSATAPAEVVAQKPNTINIPFDGVIDEVEVSPGQSVQAGDVLIRMESTLLKNRVTSTLGALKSAEISLRKTERESMQDRAKLAEIAILEAQLSQKREEANFAQEMLARADVVAESDGIAIFADSNALRGKPVQTGEQVMQVANLQEIELLIRMPVSSIIKIKEEIPARFFLNATPFNSQKIAYKTIGYQATMDADGLMTYKIRGKFKDPSENIRIGWTGTSKVYGDRTVLVVNLLRRPITTLRRKLGI